jgi:hypothetical protein
MSFDRYNDDPGPWADRANDREVQREIAEHAAHYAELHPDGAARISLTGLVRRVAARLRGRRDTGASAPTSEDVWAREEALYRAKNERERQA